MPSNLHAARRSITSGIHKILDDFGLENAVSGGKFDDLRQSVSDSTGYWESNSAISKPSRLILHLAKVNDAIVATMPPENTNGNFAYANTAKRNVGGISLRILPVIKLGEDEFKPHTDWEWLLWYSFFPRLDHGTSGQLFDGFDPASGTFTYMGKTQPYIAAGLVTLNDPDDIFADEDHDLEFTYAEASEAIRNLIHVAPTAPSPSLLTEQEGSAGA